MKLMPWHFYISFGLRFTIMYPNSPVDEYFKPVCPRTETRLDDGPTARTFHIWQMTYNKPTSHS
jgi:hypothetical protein